MKPAHERFAQLLASGRHTQVSAYIETYGDKGKKMKNPTSNAHTLAKKPIIKFRIKEIQEEYALKAGVSAEWVLNKLVDIVEGAGMPAKDVKGALDTINKMSGYYEKDNQQKALTTLKMEF